MYNKLLAVIEKKGHILKCKGFKDLLYVSGFFVFFFCSIVEVDQFLMIL